MPISIKDAAGVTHDMATVTRGSVEYPKHVASTSDEPLYADFYTFDQVNEFEVIQQGPGQIISGPLGGAAAGSGPYLNISSGVTASSKTIILGRGIFEAPVDLRMAISASQRIINNTLRVGFVECDPVTGALITSTAFATVPDVLGARNAAMLAFTGTNVSIGTLTCRAAGAALDSTSITFTGFTTAATGTGPNFIVTDSLSLRMERDRVSARRVAGNSLTNVGVQASRDTSVPNATKSYRLAIVVENSASAPASTTDWRIHFLNVMNNTRFDVSPRHAGSTDATLAFPVNIVNTPPVVNTPALPVASSGYTALAGVNANLVRNTAANLFNLTVTNLSAAIKYLKVYNKASAPVVGTDVPFQTFIMAAGKTESFGFGELGLRFPLGIGIGMTNGAADTDATAIAAGDLKVTVTYN